MAAQLHDLTLSSLVFDRSHPALQRDRIGPVDERHENYDDRYDFHTLVYDCFQDPLRGEVVLLCPALLNFRRLIDQASFSLDGQNVTPTGIETLSRGSLITFAYDGHNPGTLRISHPLFERDLTIGSALHDEFAGRNALFAISKDNRLEWIADWLRYYVSEHGADAVVLFDNQSTAYSMEELGRTLSAVPGIAVAAIVRAWFPFGPGGTGNTNFDSKFLHRTMMELGRRRILAQARAALNVDIDELVFSRSGQSVFDATVASEKGYVRFDGRWAYADAPGAGQIIRHGDHLYRRTDGRPKVSRKWCLAPTGALSTRQWLTHRIISLKDPTDPDFGFWHFRRISSNWDYNREDFDEALLEKDTRLIDTMARVFAPGSVD